MYRIENIGRVFTNKTRDELQKRLTTEARQGWYFHSVFSVTETACFGFQKMNTYYMVLTRLQPPVASTAPGQAVPQGQPSPPAAA
jgi:hypothetical protein